MTANTHTLHSSPRRIAAHPASKGPPAAAAATRRRPLATLEKAFQVNLDETKYGVIAEIGAGQEVARQFFKAGGASGTVAKTMSAYDMVVSDTIYGPSERYVSRERLAAMLDHEYERLVRRLEAPRGAETTFFAFADTVAARSHSYQRAGHGWMGVRFQTHQRSQPSQIELHVRMFDEENAAQQEALGIVGVNLIHGAFFHDDAPERLLRALHDGLAPGRAEIDVARFRGPAFDGIDHRIVSLWLVEHGLSRAALFAPDGEILQPSEALYKKPVLVARGMFRPLRPVHVALHRHALRQFRQRAGVEEGQIAAVKEMTLHHLVEGTPGGAADDDRPDYEEFLGRAEAVAAAGGSVLVSSYPEYYRLAEYLAQLTTEPVAFVAGAPTLHKLFGEQYYTDLAGGRLEAFGRFAQSAETLYVFPSLDDETGRLSEASPTPPSARHLHAHLVERGAIEYLDAPHAGALEELGGEEFPERSAESAIATG